MDYSTQTPPVACLHDLFGWVNVQKRNILVPHNKKIMTLCKSYTWKVHKKHFPMRECDFCGVLC